MIASCCICLYVYSHYAYKKEPYEVKILFTILKILFQLNNKLTSAQLYFKEITRKSTIGEMLMQIQLPFFLYKDQNQILQASLHIHLHTLAKPRWQQLELDYPN